MVSEQGALAAITAASRELKLPTLRQQAEPLAQAATKSGQTYLGSSQLRV